MRYNNQQPACFTTTVRWLSQAVAVIAAVLFLFSQPVSAANWLYLQRQEGTRYGPCTEYIDADSVFKDDKTVTYWTIWVFDEQSNHHNIMKLLQKKEASLPGQPLQRRLMERYYFDAANGLIRQYLEPIKDYGDGPDEIQRALGYAKAATLTVVPRPDHIVTPTPRWYGFLVNDDCKLYWDIHSIVVWPQDKPTTIDIRVKKVWNEAALERRKVFLSSLQPRYPRNDDGLQYTKADYQFLIEKSQFRILAETDFDGDDRRMSLVDGSAWKSVESGTIEDTIKKIALNWLKDNGESAAGNSSDR